MARAARGLRLLHVISSLNRGMRALSGAMGRRGFGYAVLVTFVVVFAGGAGMFAFENDNADGRGRNDYPTALWWTAMIVTTISSDYWSQTVEGRVLCLVLALYAFTVFGYVAATLSSFFIERDAESPMAARSSEQKQWRKCGANLPPCAQTFERCGKKTLSPPTITRCWSETHRAPVRAAPDQEAEP